MRTDISLTATQQRHVAVGLLLVPLVVILMLAAPIVAGYQEHQERMGVLGRQLLTYQTAIAQMPTTRAAVANLRRVPGLGDLILPRQKGSDAAVQLQNQIAELAAQTGVSVVQTRVKLNAAAQSLPEITAHASLEGDITSVSRFLYEIERARPLFFVRRATIRDPDGAAGERQPTGPNQLQLELDVSAFMRAS